ncbi:hypothetical protein [Brucella pseudogrignonensis]|uniref:hypothetical protein n=1 Tax=Brucella pseudogrignonensis TaxID=419475 RepID=UPI0038D13324
MEKWKSWAIGIVSTWALLAFIAWHYESTCGMFLSGACFSVYWDSLRKIVLLKWVYSYQTLIAGLAAVTGGFATLYAAKTALDSSKELARQQHYNLVVANSNYLSELFRQSAFIHRNEDLTREFRQWESVTEKINSISPIYPQLAKDMIYLWHRMSFLSEGKPTDFALITIRATSYIAATVLDDIVTHHHGGAERYHLRAVPASEDLLNFLDTEDIYLKAKLEGANVIGLVRPMDKYIDFTGTQYEDV